MWISPSKYQNKVWRASWHESVLVFGVDLERFFYFESAESLAGRGFREPDFPKSCFQRA
jgi:hypothetical protein